MSRWAGWPTCCRSCCRRRTRCGRTTDCAARAWVRPRCAGISGSIDAVLRVPDSDAGHRYVVVDYKTNRLGDVQSPSVTSDYTNRLAAAMMHSDYVFAGAPVQRCAAPVPALAVAGLPAGATSRRCALPVPAGMWGADTPWSTDIRPACSAGGHRPIWWSRSPICSRDGRWGHECADARGRASTGVAVLPPADFCARVQRRRGVDSADARGHPVVRHAGRRNLARPPRWHSPWRSARCGPVRCVSI